MESIRVRTAYEEPQQTCNSRTVLKRTGVFLVAVTLCLAYTWGTPAGLGNPIISDQMHHEVYNITVACGNRQRVCPFLFNYASLFCIALQNKIRAVIPNDAGLLNAFNLSKYQFLSQNQSLENYSKFVVGKGATYDTRVENLSLAGFSNVNIVLHGDFLSWRYFSKCDQMIRSLFTFRTDVVNAAIYNLKGHIPEAKIVMKNGFLKMSRPGYTFVGVHVKRGQYLRQEWINYGYTTPNNDYFIRAVQYLKKMVGNPHFIVSSDDIEWCRSNLIDIHPDMIFIENQQPFLDLAILAMCEHTIMSVGPLGWWAGWLTNGTTIYYQNWPREGSPLAAQTNKSDYFPSGWIPL